LCGVLVDLLRSKKFVVGITSSLTALLVRLAPKAGLGEYIDHQTATEIANQIMVLAGAYIVGQGVADHGKARAEIVADAADHAADAASLSPPPAAPGPPAAGS
jgi:hypothetical protein